MKLNRYAYNDKTQLTKHFSVWEWKCKCGKNHEIVIADTLPPLLEKVMEKIGAVRGDIYSGYRCSAHDKVVGGDGASNRSHGGYAVDIYFTDKNGKRIPSKTVALALEDLGHQYGIGYRCGGSADSSGKIHIDVKPRKWYGDESKSMTKSCCTSFYKYFGINKISKYSKGNYEVVSPRYIRTGAGIEYSIKKVKDVSKDAQKKVVNTKSTADAQLKKGAVFTASSIMYAKNNSIWAKMPSGYVCLESSKGTQYCNKK